MNDESFENCSIRLLRAFTTGPYTLSVVAHEQATLFLMRIVVLVGLQSYVLPLYFKRTGSKSYSCIVTQCVEDFFHFKQQTPLSLYWFLKIKPRRWKLCNGVAYSLKSCPSRQSWQWVSGSNGSTNLGGSRGSRVSLHWPVDPFYIVLIRYPTWFSGSWIMQKALRGDANTARWL